MPSQLHEALLLLFRNRPALAAELLRDALRVELPAFSDARIDSADLTDVQPAEYRADLVVILKRDRPVLGIVVEVQLAPDERKRFSWPAYVVNLRARFKCPVHLLVVTANEATARWARKPVNLGGMNSFAPVVIGPSGIPEMTHAAQAHADPELAVLSAIAHGNDANVEKSARIATLAYEVSLGLDENRCRLYVDIVSNALSEAARMSIFQSNELILTSGELIAKHGREIRFGYETRFARGFLREGEMLATRRMMLRMLAQRFGPLPEGFEMQFIDCPIERLDAICERLLTASTLQEAIGSR